MQLAHGFIPRLRKRGHGGIILTSSIEALMGCPYSTAYSATKSLVNALGEGLWAELEPEGIDVLTLCPGATESEAAELQGIDISKLHHVMPAREVARLTLENMRNGPVFFSSDYYRASFDKLLSLPRREALAMMAKAMKK
jgi:short-subunit dehydrogenase